MWSWVKACSLLSSNNTTVQSWHTHTHTHVYGPLSGTTGIWILLKQETVSCSGISWAIRKSAPRSRQITMPAPHRSVFYMPDALPAAQPTASKHWRQSRGHCNWQIGLIFIAKLQMYRVRRPTNNCYQTASKCTKKHIQFQKFSRGDTLGPPSAGDFISRPPSRIGKVKRWQL